MAKKPEIPVEYDEYVVKMTLGAEKDLNEIIEYIAENNPRTALTIMEKIQKKIDSLDHFPYRGSFVPELLVKNIKDFRQISEHPWKIYYKIVENKVYIMAIVDSRRNLKDILMNKLLK